MTASMAWSEMGSLGSRNPVSRLEFILTEDYTSGTLIRATAPWSQSSISPGVYFDLVNDPKDTSAAPIQSQSSISPGVYFDPKGVSMHDGVFGRNPVSRLEFILTLAEAGPKKKMVYQSQSSISPGVYFDAIFGDPSFSHKFEVAIQYLAWSLF